MRDNKQMLIKFDIKPCKKKKDQW